MITFVDQIGRTVIGEQVSETETTLVVKNPVIIHVQPNPQNGQLQVQSFPYLFVEFIDPAHRDTNNWTFHKSNIVISDVVLEERIKQQYHGINTVQPSSTTGDAEVIRLFEED